MGGHSSGLFKTMGGKSASRALAGARRFSDNVDQLKAKFPLSSVGYFGKRGTGARVIVTDNPALAAWDFAHLASGGASHLQTIPGRGYVWVMRDGTRISYRFYSSSDGSPVVELAPPDNSAIKKQKIHFVRGGK